MKRLIKINLLIAFILIQNANALNPQFMGVYSRCFYDRVVCTKSLNWISAKHEWKIEQVDKDNLEVTDLEHSGIKQSIDLSQQINPLNLDMLNYIKSQSSLAKRMLKSIYLKDTIVKDNSLVTNLYYEIEFGSNFGKFTATLRSEASISFNDNIATLHYRDNPRIIDLNLIFLGRNITEKTAAPNGDSFKLSQLFLGLVVDIGLAFSEGREKQFVKLN